ncbi:hypothetical protein [Mesorhizobium sp. M1D.F.Ca.ET.043.01.1.1]|uniref:hypothetical protein n=1 Tax=Mesorhizobium sp. M1D.F.Ca.ET.043.01.1.1 TaxID=2493669 RepID=UPI000F756E8B|nr:hypothetical protein [Mesorhizobium sp. M1D.F.Ca.ET.043.01.1.1]AZO75556.1 hypothetical protein EJ067_33555 [Mesorhizobium sp. M1D.F.Ca.ET.043.01.1.1]
MKGGISGFAFEQNETGISAIPSELAYVPQRSATIVEKAFCVCWALGRLVPGLKVKAQHACRGHRTMTMLPG